MLFQAHEALLSSRAEGASIWKFSIVEAPPLARRPIVTMAMEQTMPRRLNLWFVLARAAPAIAGWMSVSVGTAVLTGWHHDIEVLKSLAPHEASMKPNAAVGLVLAGCALLLAQAGRVRAIVVLRWSAEIALFSLAFLTLSQYVVSVDLGIDQMLIQVPPPEADTSSPGRMSRAAAANFMLCAAALMVEHWRTGWARAATRALASLMAIVALASVIGYLYDVPLFYFRTEAFTAITIHTATVQLFLAIGLIFLHPRHGLPAILTEDTLVGAQFRWLLPAVFGLPLLVGALSVQALSLFGAEMAVAVTAMGAMLSMAFVLGLCVWALRGIEHMLQLRNRALAAASQGILIVNARAPDQPVAYMNSGWTGISGYSEEETIGQPFARFVDVVPDDSAQADTLWAALSTGENATITLNCKRKYGSAFAGRFSISPMRDVSGMLDGSVVVIDDVTEDQLAEKKRLALLADVSQAREEAEAANRAKDAFLATVTHELRSPLNACMLWLDELQSDPDPQQINEVAEVLRRNLNVQARLVNDLVDVAQMASGEIDLHREPIEIGLLLQRAVVSLQAVVAERGIELDYSPADGRCMVSGDGDRLTQVLHNLIENAAGASPPGEKIEVRARVADDIVEITVEDNGIGLSAADADKVFQPFWKGRDATREKRKGLGLGLSIAKYLVERHQGTLSVSSEGHDLGTTFTLRLRTLCQASSDASESQVSDMEPLRRVDKAV